jgi:hypothetical protein
LALAVAGTACAGLPSALKRGTGTELTVVAPLLAAPGRPIFACYYILLPYPPLDTCGGVEVRNVDVAAVAALGGGQPFKGGTRMSLSVRLVGTWNEQALTLTKRPVRAENPVASPLPSPMIPLPPPSGETAALAEARRIIADSSLRGEGVKVMEAGVGTHGKDVDVKLVVADARAIQALHRHYDSVYVTGWLQPVAPTSGS